jgi:TPR repeat protein
MYIKNIILFTFLTIGIFSSNSYSVLSEILFVKKYSFSDSSLDETKALNYIIGNGENSEEVFQFMWEEAIKGNEKVQLKLLLLFTTNAFYNKATQRIPSLLNTHEYSLNSLINMGIEQEKSWAFYEKAKTETDHKEKFILLNKANNFLPPQLASKSLRDNIDEKRKPLVDEILPTIESIKDTEKNKVRINRFINDIAEYKYGSFLFFIYTRLKTKNPDYANTCLKAASELGYITASIELGYNYNLQKNNDAAYECFLKAALKNDIGSMYNAGVKLINKESILHHQEGLKWLLKAADNDDIDAMYHAAITLKRLSSTPSGTDIEKIFNLLYEAAKNGHADAMAKLGKMLQQEFVGRVPNIAESAQYLLKASQQNHPKAMYHYGLLLKNGFANQQPNLKKGNEWINKAANLGCEVAMNYVAARFMGWIKGEEQTLNKKEAYNCFLKASEKDDIARFNAANMIGCGFNKIKPNLKKAISFLLPAAKNEQIESMILLARFYLQEAINENNKTSFKNAALWLNKAKEYGYFDTILKSNSSLSSCLIRKIRYRFTFTEKAKIREIHNLACLHYEGYADGKENKEEAFRLFLCAAKNNYTPSMSCVADMLLDGFEGQEPDPKEAAYWFSQAAENDHTPSMVKVAKLYITIPDFSKDPQNFKDALFWLQKADALNEPEAHTYLKICETLLNNSSESQIDDESLVNLIEQTNKLEPSFAVSDLLSTPNEENLDHTENDSEEITIAFSEDNNEIAASPEMPEILPLYTDYKNPKFIRNHFRELGLLKKQQKDQEQNAPIFLSTNNQLIVDMLLDKKITNKNIDYHQLVVLFKDPFFENQVKITKSKCGCVIIAKNYKTLRHEATSTHKKHGQSYDGLNRDFARELISILQMFDLGIVE